MAKKVQSRRLTVQHKQSKGVLGIFGEEAKKHDANVSNVSLMVLNRLKEEFPSLNFRHRSSVTKREINDVLKKVDKALGKMLFVKESSIKPDGGIVEVQDDAGHWRVILVPEAKHQGKDIENIKKGVLVGKADDQDTMVAGNAIERAHKNISEIANLMLAESHFPYVLFIEGSNFLTKTIKVSRPDGRIVTLVYNDGSLNRLDRLTCANYGMPFNKNLCRNKFVHHGDKSIMLQAASIYTRGDGGSWEISDMFDIMIDIARTSLNVLGSDLFKQLTKGRGEKTK